MMKLSTSSCIMKLLLYFSHVMLFLGRTLLDDVYLDVISYNSFQVCLLWQICNSKMGMYIHFLFALSIYGEMRLSTPSSSYSFVSFFFPYDFHVHPHRLKAIQNSACSKTEVFLLWIIIQCSQTHSNQFCLPVKFIFIYFSARENSSVLFPLVWLFGLGFVCFFFFSLRGVSSEQMFYYSDWKIMKQVEFIPEMDFIPSYQHLI